MNFQIIDGDQDWLQLIPEFTRLYNNKNIRVNTIKKRINIGKNTYFKLLRECREKGLITPRRRPNKKPDTYKTKPKYYHHAVTKGIEYYRVVKRINGENTYFAQFKKARQAELMVEKLKECDWDYSRRYELKREVLSECP